MSAILVTTITLIRIQVCPRVHRILLELSLMVCRFNSGDFELEHKKRPGQPIQFDDEEVDQ